MNIKNDFHTSTSISLVNSGKDYFYRLEKIILDAKKEIHLQTYIFAYDNIGKRIVEVLKKSLSKGVQIYILLDGFGSSSFPVDVQKDLEKNGAHFRLYSKNFSLNFVYFLRRLHHKIIVVDSKIAIIGGINISDKYRGTSTEKPWLDYAVEINNSETGKFLQKLCSDIYFKKGILIKKQKKTFPIDDKIKIKILQNDWIKGKKQISRAYLDLIENAKEEIIIVGSYFLPGRKLIELLRKASERGVAVKLILAGVSDVALINMATNHLYEKLLRYNIELYEWKKSILHGKTAVIDQKITMIGSFNLNSLSSYRSIEMNVKVVSSVFSENYRQHLEKILKQSRKISPRILKVKFPAFVRLTNFLVYISIRVLEFFVTYSPYKTRKKEQI